MTAAGVAAHSMGGEEEKKLCCAIILKSWINIYHFIDRGRCVKDKWQVSMLQPPGSWIKLDQLSTAVEQLNSHCRQRKSRCRCGWSERPSEFCA